MKVAVYVIALNEANVIERCMASADDADYRLVVDTGSGDETRALAERAGARVQLISVRPWRFDVARNAALALLPDDLDVCIALDADEVLEPGWRAEIERVWVPRTTHLQYLYQWSADNRHYSNKIHARHGYVWRQICHEWVYPDPRTEERWAETDQLLIRHLADPEKPRDYLPLLVADYQECPSSLRSLYHYGRELVLHKDWPAAIAVLRRYLELSAEASAVDESYVCRILATAYEAVGEITDAYLLLHRATRLTPHQRQAWGDLAMLLGRQRCWAECYAATERALEITHDQPGYFGPNVYRGGLLYDLGSVAAWHMGFKARSQEWAAKALESDPPSERVPSLAERMNDG